MNALERAIVEALGEGSASGWILERRVRTAQAKRPWSLRLEILALRFVLGFYPTLRALAARGVIERRSESGGPERGFRTRFIYSAKAVRP
jgi:hypothetical protein